MKSEEIGRYYKYIQLLFIILILVTIGLRFYKLDYEDLWHDETHDVYFACDLNLKQGLYESTAVHHFPLHIFILHFWLKLFPFTIFWIRLPYAIIGTLSVFAFFWLCKIINQKKGTLFPYLATLLFGLSNNSMYYSQEVRDYIYVIFLSILCFCSLLKFWDKRKLRYIALYIISMTFLLYANFFGVLILLSCNVCNFFLYLTDKDKLSRTRYWIVAQAIVILCYIPLFFTAKNTLFVQFDKGIAMFSYVSSSFRQLLLYYSYLLHSGTFTKDTLLDIILRCVLTFFLFYYIAKNCYLLILEKRKYFFKKDSKIFIILIFWALIPSLLIYIISELKTPILHFRYIIICAVPVLLIAMQGFYDVPRKFRMVILFILLVLYTSSYIHWFNAQKKPKYTSTFKYVYDNSLKENPVIFFNPSYLALPIMCNISTKETIGSRDVDIYDKLKYRNINVYNPIFLDNIISEKKSIEFFALIDWVGGEDVEKDLNRRSNIFNIDTKVTNPFTIKHFVVLKDSDKIVNCQLYNNVFYNDGVSCKNEYNTLYPEQYDKRSEIIYEFLVKDYHVNIMLLNIQAYMIFKNNYIKIYCGKIPENMDLLYQYENKKDGQEIIMKTFDISKYVKDKSQFYIKIELFTDKKYSRTLWDSRLEKFNLIMLNKAN